MRLWLAPSAFYPSIGGVEELSLKLAQHWLEDGVEVTVITNRWPADLPPSETVNGVPVRRIAFPLPGRHPRSWFPYVAGRRRAARELLALGPPPDLVHFQCLSSQLPHLAEFAYRRSIPTVLTTQGEVVMDAGRLYQISPYMRRALRRYAASAGALTACSRWTASATAGVAPAFADAEVILNGVDLDDWRVTRLPDEPVLAAWGRHVPQKGFGVLLEAFRHVKTVMPQARLLLGGSGPLTEGLRRAAPPDVEFLGALNRLQVDDMLARARVVVVPSRIEPFGIVAVEALAAGRGLVYAAGTGLEEAAGGRGRAADASHPHSLALALVEELRRPTPAAEGRARAEELVWTNISSEYRRVHKRVIAQAAAGGPDL